MKSFHACLSLVRRLFFVNARLLYFYFWTMLGLIEVPDGYRQSSGIGWMIKDPVFPQINLRTHLLPSAGWVKAHSISCPPHWAECRELTLTYDRSKTNPWIISRSICPFNIRICIFFYVSLGFDCLLIPLLIPLIDTKNI